MGRAGIPHDSGARGAYGADGFVSEDHTRLAAHCQSQWQWEFWKADVHTASAGTKEEVGWKGGVGTAASGGSFPAEGGSVQVQK